MNENLKTRGPAVRAEQLIDVYRARQDVPSPWTVISDRVMGGVSSAALQQDDRHNSPCTCLAGRTRLENNGEFSGSEFSGSGLAFCLSNNPTDTGIMQSKEIADLFHAVSTA